MPDRSYKMRRLKQSESPMKTPPTTTRRFHVSTIANQIVKLFASANPSPKEIQKPDKPFTLPSISITSPEGQTTVVE